MSKWQKVKLKELLSIRNGKDHKSLQNGIYPVYGSGGIMRYANNYIYDKESILLPRKGTLNNIQFATFPFWTIDTCYYTEIYRDKVIPYFLYRYLSMLNIAALNTGSAIPSMTFDRYYSIEVLLPPIDTQRRIADILSRYDALIENYQKQIKLLEEAAQRLYKEWFVDLRFPGYENTKINDGVPEGWERKSISEVCNQISSGSTPSRNNKSYWENGNIKWVKTKELQDGWILDTEEYITSDGLNNSSLKLYPSNTILMAIYASPTLGRLGILATECCCNQAALGLIVNEEIVSWQWLFLKLYELRNDFNAIARGAGQQNISGEVVKNWEIIVPNINTIKNFTNLVFNLFETKKYLSIQIHLLIEARNRLLPKLMNGEIDV